MLRLIDTIGGIALTFLLGKKVSWKDVNDEAKQIRVFVGAVTSGLILGVVFYVLPILFKSLNVFGNDNGTKAWIAFVGVPVASVALTFWLESIDPKFK
ncbi:MAG TPA: hypothetical protein VE961_11280 [Pyrinomonadaceae bacterium]|nr:hypothetical protein [Pyrinomonadaceae bacterium]